MRFVASYSDIAVMVFNLDEPYLVGCELSFLSEESHDVSFAYFFFFFLLGLGMCSLCWDEKLVSDEMKELSELHILSFSKSIEIRLC